jgi:uncharacterized protein
MNGCYIVLDVHSGAVHVVDKLVYGLLDVYQDNSIADILVLPGYAGENAEEIKEGYEEIKALESAGLLYSKDDYDQSVPGNERQPVVKALCLHIAHDCNLKCGYCFAEEGEYHGARSLMSFEVGKKAIDFLIGASGNRKNLEIDFFGGEPTLNFDVVKQIVAYARDVEKEHNKNFRFTLTTNGVLLNDEMIAYINETMQNVVLSIDGRKEMNDAMRKRAGGQGSYDLIVPKFQQLAESRNQDNYYVRGTYTRYNLDFSKDVLHLADLGFQQISVEPVVGDAEKDYTLRPEDLPVLCKEYEDLAVRLLQRKKDGKPFHFFHFMIDLSGGPCVAKRLAGCGAGAEYLAVTPEGDLYPCHQFTGMTEFKMGDVDAGVTNTAQRAEFDNCTVYAKEDCKACWAKFYCSGGCAANAYTTNGDILKPYQLGCDLQRKRIECAIMIKAAQI